MTHYEKQTGYVMRNMALMISLALLAYSYFNPPINYLNILMVIALIGVSFLNTLTIEITETDFKINYGHGFYKKTIPINEIIEIKTLKNKNGFYFTWGVKKVTGSNKTTIHIKGNNGIEIKTKNNEDYIIATENSMEIIETINQNKKDDLPANSN